MPNINNHKIFSLAAKQYWQAWLIAFIWNAITWFAIIKGGHNILRAFEESPVFYFFVLFPFIGIWTIISAIRQTLAWYKFGKTPIILNPTPGQIGGQCAGYIILPIPAEDAKQATLSLSCIRSYTHRSSDGTRSRREEAIWQDRITLKPDKYGRKKSRLSFAFNPPAHLPETEQESDNYHLWRIQVRLSIPGIDYDRLFELPMEKVDEQTQLSHRHFKTQSSAIIEQQNAEVSSIPQIKTTTKGTQFYYGYGRSKLMAIILMVFGLSLAVFGYFFFDGFLDFLPATASLMSAFVSLTALILFLLGLFLIANSLIVEVGLMGVRKQQRIFGYLLEEKIAADNIVKIITEKNASSTSGNTTRVWYRLKLYTCDGQHIEVGDTLEGQSYAEEIRQQMMTALGTTWRSASFDKPEEKSKKPLPIWLRWIGKLSSYSFPIALLYDLSINFPVITEFLGKVVP